VGTHRCPQLGDRRGMANVSTKLKKKVPKKQQCRTTQKGGEKWKGTKSRQKGKRAESKNEGKTVLFKKITMRISSPKKWQGKRMKEGEKWAKIGIGELGDPLRVKR